MSDPVKVRIRKLRTRGASTGIAYLDAWCKCSCNKLCPVTISVNWYTSGPLANLLIAKQKQ
eukprot:4920818-Karenia_brevis.AAC.1